VRDSTTTHSSVVRSYNDNNKKDSVQGKWVPYVAHYITTTGAQAYQKGTKQVLQR